MQYSSSASKAEEWAMGMLGTSLRSATGRAESLIVLRNLDF